MSWFFVAAHVKCITMAIVFYTQYRAKLQRDHSKIKNLCLSKHAAEKLFKPLINKIPPLRGGIFIIIALLQAFYYNKFNTPIFGILLGCTRFAHHARLALAIALPANALFVYTVAQHILYCRYGPVVT